MVSAVRLLVVGAIALAGPPIAHADPVAEPLARPALSARVAQHTVLMALASAGNRLVAAGERGIILLSDDAGRGWRQAKVPVSVSLTAVSFPTPRHGWAVGHYGVVLHSEDGGETWVRQMDGVVAAKLALESAQARASRAGAADASAQRLLTEAMQLEADGPDKPFLDVHFENERSGFIVGAYNLMLRTEDGGRSWRYWGDRLDNPKSNHIYAIRAAGGDIYVAGEQGLLARSADGGKTFVRLEPPYKGSYFALAAFASGDLVVAGLRGNAFRSADRGASWRKIELPAPVSVSALKPLQDGGLLMANQAGQMFLSLDRGQTLSPIAAPALPPINAIEQLPDGSLLAVGVMGAMRVPAAAGKQGGKP
jgi:photosystem II stability/assembly factor-like uncharacterized protein